MGCLMAGRTEVRHAMRDPTERGGTVERGVITRHALDPNHTLLHSKKPRIYKTWRQWPPPRARSYNARLAFTWPCSFSGPPGLRQCAPPLPLPFRLVRVSHEKGLSLRRGFIPGSPILPGFYPFFHPGGFHFTLMAGLDMKRNFYAPAFG